MVLLWKVQKTLGGGVELEEAVRQAFEFIGFLVSYSLSASCLLLGENFLLLPLTIVKFYLTMGLKPMKSKTVAKKSLKPMFSLYDLLLGILASYAK